MLQKRNQEGPRICLLCRQDPETTSHFFQESYFSQQIWKDLSGWMGTDNIWNKECLEDRLKVWYERQELKIFRPIPYLVCWGICIARNAILFENRFIPSFHVCDQTCAIYNHCKPTVKDGTPGQVGEVVVDKNIPWGYFDGARQGPDSTCSMEGILHFSDSHSL